MAAITQSASFVAQRVNVAQKPRAQTVAKTVVCAKVEETQSRRVVFSALAAAAISSAVAKPAMALDPNEQIRRRNCESTRGSKEKSKICSKKK
mmetsp:Transcript_21825/g.47905  ORF Transcript_21825/g.47905 Transcript_21825/m.47905 type:complete len:93 (-) Transcript_21825:80-358(-)|eukprot:CAMPEP_0118920838 /NCGR_PEP_ID=MMETSP1169-20130426/270_1 /TAXON_ID=36882 /ORGANISM="Pyramimonas obovata, Strain CCMP722" /LENGTH=92 /DNA_ID=CAMNT_0006861443 /DNA_START=75 /DNA_END=353 /DNA_ORIENTATION=-